MGQTPWNGMMARGSAAGLPEGDQRYACLPASAPGRGFRISKVEAREAPPILAPLPRS